MRIPDHLTYLLGIPEHLTCLLRNLYAGQEATLRTGHGTTDQFKIGKGLHQACILLPCLFNLYSECMLSHFSHVWLCDPTDYNPLGSSVQGILQQEYCSELPFPPPESLPNPGIEPTSLMSSASEGRFLTTSTTWEALICRVHHAKRRAGWIINWNQDCWEKYQPQTWRWYHFNGKKWKGTKETLMRVKEASEKPGLNFDIQKTKIMASGPITSWQIDGETMAIVTLYFLGLQNHCRWWLQLQN